MAVFVFKGMAINGVAVVQIITEASILHIA
jgi:hypothetical protein